MLVGALQALPDLQALQAPRVLLDRLVAGLQALPDLVGLPAPRVPRDHRVVGLLVRQVREAPQVPPARPGRQVRLGVVLPALRGHKVLQVLPDLKV